MSRPDISTERAGDLEGEPVLLAERHFGAFAGHHYSGGDDLVREDLDAGRVTYWTVVYASHRATACSGRRWRSRQHATKWLERQRESLAWLVAPPPGPTAGSLDG